MNLGSRLLSNQSLHPTTNMTTSFLSKEHATLIQRSRDEDLIWAVKTHIKETRVSPFESVFRKFFLEALERGDMDAIMKCHTIYSDHDTGHSLPAWECATCGCSDRHDFYGDRICRCDSCPHDCESSESKLSRGCKRSRDEYEAGLACSIVAGMLETMLDAYEFDIVLSFLRTIVAPPSMAYIFDEATDVLLETMRSTGKDTDTGLGICERAHKLTVFHKAYGYICLGETCFSPSIKQQVK